MNDQNLHNVTPLPIDEVTEEYPPVLDKMQEEQNRDEKIMEEFKTAINSYNAHGYDPKGLPAFLTGWFGENNPTCHIEMTKSFYISV